jgi:hypothetical protein
MLAHPTQKGTLELALKLQSRRPPIEIRQMHELEALQKDQGPRHSLAKHQLSPKILLLNL